MKTNQARAAALIRKDLKKAFPGVKFSVTSQGYAGGDNVDVRYENGPVGSAVEKVVAKYQMGSFNGMEDIYEYDNYSDDLPQTKYLFVSRGYSEDVREKAEKKIKDTYGLDPQSWEFSSYLQKELSATSL